MSSNIHNQDTKQKPKNSFLARVGISPLAFLLTGIIAIIFLPTFILLLGGMLPSLLAFAFDDTVRKSKCKSTSYLNLSGCIIVGLDLWTGGNSVDDALNIFLQPTNWVIMYGLAMFGWILSRSLDPFISSYLKLSYEADQKNLRKRRKALLLEWGEKVTKVSNQGEFIYDHNVYLDDDDVEVDPDESIDIIPDDGNEPKMLEDHSTADSNGSTPTKTPNYTTKSAP